MVHESHHYFFVVLEVVLDELVKLCLFHDLLMLLLLLLHVPINRIVNILFFDLVGLRSYVLERS